MRVVLSGSRNRSEMTDTALVNAIIDQCKEQHSNLIVVVASCDKGVGKIVKSRNLDPHLPKKLEFDMIEVSLRHYLSCELPRSEFTSHWNAVNATLVELGDEFHLLTDEFPKGAVFDLLKRVKDKGLPYALYKPNEKEAKKTSFDVVKATSFEEAVGEGQ